MCTCHMPGGCFVPSVTQPVHPWYETQVQQVGCGCQVERDPNPGLAIAEALDLPGALRPLPS